MSVVESLKNSSIVWAILAVCTCLSVPAIIFSVYTWIKGKRKKEFTYARTTFQLVRKGVSTIDKLKLSFGDKPISDLSVTRFTIWNSGTEKIEQVDLYKDEPLRIINSENAQILDASIVPESNEREKFKITLDEKDVVINFECAEKKDGFVIQVIHSGAADELKPAIGIKGGKELRAYYITKSKIINMLKFTELGVTFGSGGALATALLYATGKATAVIAAVVTLATAVIAVFTTLALRTIVGEILGVIRITGLVISGLILGLAGGIVGGLYFYNIPIGLSISNIMLFVFWIVILHFDSQYKNDLAIPSKLRKYVEVKIIP